MERSEAIQRIRPLVGTDLRPLADRFGITVWKGPNLNKGWVGHTIERHLGLALNSSRAPNFGSWELKVVSLRHHKSGELRVKETMAITMIDPVEVAAKEFEDSHMFLKLQRMLVVARTFEDKSESHAFLHNVLQFNLDDTEIRKQVKADYDLVRTTIKSQGFEALTGRMGVLVQPRTKGQGHGTTSRAFYARTRFVARILGLPSGVK